MATLRFHALILLNKIRPEAAKMAIHSYQMAIESFKKMPPEDGICILEGQSCSMGPLTPSKNESHRIRQVEDL